MSSELFKNEVSNFLKKRWSGNFNEFVGIEFLDASKDFAKMRLRLKSEVLQPTGILHGGAIFTLMDSTGGVAAHLSYPGQNLVTLEMKVNFIRPVSSGYILAESSPLHRGRKTSVWQVKVTDEEDRSVAFATATYMISDTPAEKNIFPIFE
ncbi:MAG: PaaI family thioesterase [Nitrospinota bacterium]|nr:PaaI family thioesterase [Nitrospinota bacterium]